MQADDIRVMRMVETTMIDEQSRVVAGIRVEYMVGEHGPFSETFPRAGFSAVRARQRLEEMRAELVRLARP